jgi:hypothetical protein
VHDHRPAEAKNSMHFKRRDKLVLLAKPDWLIA